MKLRSDLPFYALVIFAVYMVPQPAHAYIDPTTGSYAVQAAFGAAFAGLYYAKAMLNWVRSRARQVSLCIKKA